VAPSAGVPETAGAVRTDGGIASTAAVGAEDARAVPATFVAVTATRRVPPTSAEVAPYVLCVAPGMSAHPDPSAPQRRHC